MAAYTVLRRGGKVTVGMALFALSSLVRAIQFEGHIVMVKNDFLPIFRAVTLRAVAAKARFMGVIFLMATGAIVGSASIRPIGMAAFAIDLAV